VLNQEDKNMDVSVDKLVSVYIKMRDERDRVKQSMEKQVEDIEAQMKVISAELLDICKEAGVDSFRTPFGTAYRTLKSRYWTNDWENFHKFMKEQFLEENPDTHPAGLQVEKEYAITIRRK